MEFVRAGMSMPGGVGWAGAGIRTERECAWRALAGSVKKKHNRCVFRVAPGPGVAVAALSRPSYVVGGARLLISTPSLSRCRGSRHQGSAQGLPPARTTTGRRDNTHASKKASAPVHPQSMARKGGHIVRDRLRVARKGGPRLDGDGGAADGSSVHGTGSEAASVVTGGRSADAMTPACHSTNRWPPASPRHV